MGDVTLVLREARDEALDTKSFFFDAEGLGEAAPGQYLMVKLDVPSDTRRGSRSFTMANGPREGRVMITTRIRPTSPFKRAMAALHPDDRVAAKGPFGKFILPEEDGPVMCLAGGIGVTPFRSMIRHAIDTRRPIPITLLTSDRTPEAIAFREEIDGWAKATQSLRVARTVSRPAEPTWPGRTGRIDTAWIEAHLPDPGNTTALVAGPPAFVAGMRDLLHPIGFPDERIRLEQFIGY